MSILLRPSWTRDSKNGLYHINGRVHNPSLGVRVPSALRAGHQFVSLGGGGGSQINNIGVAYSGLAAVQAGDLILLCIHSEWGTQSTPNVTPCAVTDPVGNVWKSLKYLMIDTHNYSPPAGAFPFQSKYAHEVLYTIHKGGAMGTLNVVSPIDVQAWDVQAFTNLSVWSNGRAPILVEGTTQFNVAQTTCPNYRAAKNRQNIFSSVCQSNGNAFNGASGGPGFSGVDLAVNWYVLQKLSATSEIVIPQGNLTQGVQADLSSIAICW